MTYQNARLELLITSLKQHKLEVSVEVGSLNAFFSSSTRTKEKWQKFDQKCKDPELGWDRIEDFNLTSW